MLGLDSTDEQIHFCEVTVLLLRLEVYSLNNDLFLIDQRLSDQLNPPRDKELAALYAVRKVVLRNRRVSATLIQDIREVLVSPPSLESRVFGYITRVLSFRYV